MKNAWLLICGLLFINCSKKFTRATESEILNDTLPIAGKFDTLSAYKYKKQDPNQPVKVKGYYRKDSTYVKPYERKVPTSN